MLVTILIKDIAMVRILTQLINHFFFQAENLLKMVSLLKLQTILRMSCKNQKKLEFIKKLKRDFGLSMEFLIWLMFPKKIQTTESQTPRRGMANGLSLICKVLGLCVVYMEIRLEAKESKRACPPDFCYY